MVENRAIVIHTDSTPGLRAGSCLMMGGSRRCLATTMARIVDYDDRQDEHVRVWLELVGCEVDGTHDSLDVTQASKVIQERDNEL